MDEILKLIPVYEKLADKKTGLCQYDLFLKNLGFESNENASFLFNMFDQVLINIFIFYYYFFNSIYILHLIIIIIIIIFDWS